MFEIKEIRGGYSKEEILHGVSLKAQAGAVTAILGPNGCGKSTLLKMLSGILPATSGQALLNGKDLLTLSQKQAAQEVSYLPQTRQIPDMSVERLVLHGRFPYLNYPRRYREQDYQTARKVMKQMNILELAQTPLNQLSGGQRQKAYLAMALAQDTDVILLDEPTTYLDISYQLQFLRQARMLADSGKHVLMVLHDLPFALETADQIVLMAKGSVVMQGTPEEIYESKALEDVFHIRVVRVSANHQWHYLVLES